MAANLRGFHTNILELTYRFVKKSNADIVFVSETFLDDRVPWNSARMTGNSPWIKKNRSTLGRGVAMFYKEALSLVQIDTAVPNGIDPRPRDPVFWLSVAAGILHV